MTLHDYQQAALRTSAAPFDNRERPLVQGLGLCGEAGEVADLLKKQAWHGLELDREKLAEELGDVLWYLADLASHFGLNLDDIARLNIDKLAARYPHGFTIGGGIRVPDHAPITPALPPAEKCLARDRRSLEGRTP